MLSEESERMLIIVGITVGSTVIVLALTWHCRWVLRTREFWIKGIRLQDDPAVRNQHEQEEPSPRQEAIAYSKSSESVVHCSTDSSSDASGSTNILRLLTTVDISATSDVASIVGRDIEEGLARKAVESASNIAASWKQQAVDRLQAYYNATGNNEADLSATERNQAIQKVSSDQCAVHCDNQVPKDTQDDFTVDSGIGISAIGNTQTKRSDNRIGIGPLCMCF